MIDTNETSGSWKRPDAMTSSPRFDTIIWILYQPMCFTMNLRLMLNSMNYGSASCGQKILWQKAKKLQGNIRPCWRSKMCQKIEFWWWWIRDHLLSWELSKKVIFSIFGVKTIALPFLFRNVEFFDWIQGGFKVISRRFWIFKCQAS